MPYLIDWYIPDEVIYIHYTGETSPDELRESLIQLQSMIDSSSRQLVHVISDAGDVTKPLAPKDALSVVREVGTHDRSGWNIILREKSFLVKMGVAFGMSVFKTRNRTFDTLEEANAFLKQMDADLNWNKVNQSIVPY